MGRPVQKFVPDVRKRILQAIATGNHLKTAAQYGGVTYQMFRRWILRGQALAEQDYRSLTADEKEYVDFFNEVQEAEARAEVSIVASWRKAIPSDWRAGRDFLARRHPDRWGQRVEIEVSQKDEEIISLMDALGMAEVDSLGAAQSLAIDAGSEPAEPVPVEPDADQEGEADVA